MDEKIVQRGFVPSDKVEFDSKNISLLQKAQSHIYFLLNNEYNINKSVEFVGNHFLLSARQRLALKRSSSSYKDIKRRKDHQVNCDFKNSTIYIDGLNIIITLEVALSNSTLIHCMDGTIRDLAGLRGTYKLIDKTDIAISLIGHKLNEMHPKKVVFYLDSPVSNTGRLKTRILELFSKYDFEVDVILLTNPDVILSKLTNVVTSDGIILNSCESWINLAYEIINESIENSSHIDLRSTNFDFWGYTYLS